MAMISRERVLAALRREVPDRVPYCELSIARSLAEEIMGWGQLFQPMRGEDTGHHGGAERIATGAGKLPA